MENNIEMFQYRSNAIPMRNVNGIVYINMTEVAKAFPRKNLSTIINSQEIKEYIGILSEIKNFSSADLLIVKKGGNNKHEQGTWAHQKLAFRICQKLSPHFAIWVDTKIEELLLTGSTVIDRYDKNKREFPRAFSRNGLGRLHADNFKYGEIFFYSGDLLDLLGITLNSERNALIQRFGDQSFTRMEGPDGRIYFSERGTFAFLVERFNEKSHQVINWIFTEIIPTLRGESVVHKTSVSASSLRPFHQEESLFRLLDIACQVPDRELRERLRETILQMKTQSSIDTIN